MMSGIESASVFFDESKPGGLQDKVLTVLVTVKPLGTNGLDEKTVSAIRKMMPAAFAGLKLENVTVADLNGRTWCGTDQLREETSAEKDKHAAPLVPKPAGATTPRTGQRDHLPSTAPPPKLTVLGFGRNVLDWVNQSRSTLGIIGLGLVCVLALRSMIRAGRQADRQATPAGSDMSDAPQDEAIEPTEATPPAPLARFRPVAQRGAFRNRRRRPRDGRQCAASWIGQGV